MKRFILAVALLLSPSMAETAPKPLDFASGIPLSLKETAAVYRLTLPRQVYETVTRDDLSDIRVFNSADAVVPHVLRRPKKPPEPPDHSTVLPFFPLYGEEGLPGNEGLSMRVEKNGAKTSIQVFSGEAEGQERSKISGYIIDAGRHKGPIRELEVLWKEDDGSFVLSVSVAFSRDMTHWTPLVPHATLVRMQYRGHEIRRNRIRIPDGHVAYMAPRTMATLSPYGRKDGRGEAPVPEPKGPYYRLTWPAGSEGMTVTGIRAVRRRGKPEPERQWTALSGKPGSGDADRGTATYEYESPARLPVDRIRLRFSENNTLAEATLFSRPDPEAAWQPRKRGVFYRLTFDETTLVQDTASVGPTADRYWKLAVKEEALSDPGTVPALELGWLPHELLFVARGEGPFMLAYGSARLGKEVQGRDTRDTRDTQEALARMMTGDREGLVREAAAQPARELGGPDRLVPPPPPVPWRTWLLWGVLVIGVGVIAVMALSLGKGLGREKDG